MPETEWKYRVSLIVPASRKAGLDQFIAEEFDENPWLIVPLSASGSGQPTHYGTCFACTHEQTSKWATRLTSAGGVPLPPTFAVMSVDQRIAFMEAAGPTLKGLTGVVCRVCRNDQIPWAITFDAAIQAEGLKKIGE